MTINAISVEVPEVQADLAELLHRVSLGEEVIISQSGTPIARLVPIIKRSFPRIPGQDRGKVVIAPDFDDDLPERVLNDFLSLTD